MSAIVNLEQQFALINGYWDLKTVGEFNGQKVEVAKLVGEYEWHSHQEQEKLFMVVKGTLKIEFREKQYLIEAGEFIIIPSGKEHKPSALTDETWIMLIEPV